MAVPVTVRVAVARPNQAPVSRTIRHTAPAAQLLRASNEQQMVTAALRTLAVPVNYYVTRSGGYATGYGDIDAELVSVDWGRR